MSGRILKQVFISYRHESLEHAASVLRLGKRLRDAGLEVALDQFLLEDQLGGPDKGGWPKWCADAANDPACVLVIGSSGWFAAYEGSFVPRADGLGVAWEAHLFRQYLYKSAGNNERIRLAYLHSKDGSKVPSDLSPWHSYPLFASDGKFNEVELSRLVGWAQQRLALLAHRSTGNTPPDPAAPVPNPADRINDEQQVGDPPDPTRLVLTRPRTPTLFINGWFRVQRRFAQLCKWLRRHRKALVASAVGALIVFVTVMMVFVNHTNSTLLA